jgi:hypothetical protein
MRRACASTEATAQAGQDVKDRLLESRSRVLDDVGIDSDADPDDADPSIIDLDLGNQWPYSPAILIQPCNRQMTDVS